MKVFVVNCGSSSIKYRLFDMAEESEIARGVLERVGGRAVLRHAGRGEEETERAVEAADHAAGMRVVLDALTGDGGVLDSAAAIDGVGHRVVHGGRDVAESVRIDGELLGVIRRNAELAPLHNPPNLMGIEAAMAAMPEVGHVAVFDTAFLATLPPVAYRYAVPESWYLRHHVRRYGFHGTSHRYVTLRAAELLGKDPSGVNLITAHLGNGCSMTAVAAGKAVDHTMGMTPLEGLVMGTRCGDLDPAVVLHMLDRGLSPEQVDEALNERSGLRGLGGGSSDMRDVLGAAAGGDKKAELAVSSFVYRIVKYVGAFCAILPGVDALVLTGGIGENAVAIRTRICAGLKRLGVAADAARNARTVGGAAGPISADGAALPVWVIPTNEELLIARDVRRILSGPA